jgi:hypothetical protein
MAHPHIPTNQTETEPRGMEDNERVDCGHYEYVSQATPTPGGALLCQACSARLWLLQNAPEQPIEVEEPQRITWRTSLERLFTALH